MKACWRLLGLGERGEWEEQLRNGRGVSFEGDENVSERIDRVYGMQHHECTKCHQIVHFKMINFMLWKFHFKF